MKIVKETLDLKDDLEFGMAYNRSQATFKELLGARAYQRAYTKIRAEENARIRSEQQS